MPDNQKKQQLDQQAGSESPKQDQQPELTLQQRRALTIRKAILPSIVNGARNMESHADAPHGRRIPR